MTERTEESAAFACIAALTEWFEPGLDTGSLVHVGTQDPGHVVEYLFGTLAATIGHFCEVEGIDPSEYVRQLAIQLHEDVYLNEAS